ncbi:MAG: LysR family transcriptional regulator [Verrucomicrobiaceae bacterium]|nr:LysR family transcriptional regulator [Verrucomicrobiaceae bacterium]
MNVHHLELFYYVARHGGISAAARHIPYGIQQPAISAQVMQLEDSLGVTLFQRRPFSLTAEGKQLYNHISDFFSGLNELELRLRGGAETRLRLAAPEIVQREYLPQLLAQMRKRIKGFHFTLTHGRQPEIERLLAAGEADLGLAISTDKPSHGIHSRELLRLYPVLLVPEKSRIAQAEDLFKMDRIDLPLITQEPGEVLVRQFNAELQKRGITWPATLELSGIDIISRYVAQGFGIGLAVNAPGITLGKGVRELPLHGFKPLSFSLLWAGRLSAVHETFVEELQALAGKLCAGR